MGSGPSKPPPVRTSVRKYPGSQGKPMENGHAASPEFKGPKTDIPPIPEADKAPGRAEDGEEAITPEAPVPVVVTEECLITATSEDRDLMLDDGEPAGNAKTEVTTKETNKQSSAFGRQVQQLRNSEATEPTSTGRPEVEPGELWTDQDYCKNVAMEGQSDGVQWARPKDFLENPCLYSDGTCRYDIEQGSVGTCWFLSVVQSLADQPEYMKWIIPEDSYRIGTDEYDGIFHCRFWQFGEWVDVYVDDFIPVLHGKPWGARSKSDPNELWVTLIEKAFSKFHGSYLAASGGMAHRAFGALTAGTSEVLELNGTPPTDFYKRAKNSLACGSILATSVLRDGDVMGLVGNHSYTITGVCKVPYKNKRVPLLRIRNPWGGAKGEWKGAWSDGSSEWDDVAPSDKQAMNKNPSGDGEFWMSFNDFFQYFGNVSVCNFTPDVDLDGKTDDMNKVWEIFGEWKGQTAASWENKLRNPKYEFEIPKKGIPKTGTPVAIEFIQAIKHRKSQEDILNIKADLFKVDYEYERGGRTCRLLRELTSKTVYWGGESFTYRYPGLAPGKYMLVPHYSQEPGVEKEFLIRIFSQLSLACSEVKEETGFYTSTVSGEGIEYQGKNYTTEQVDRRYGAWVANNNAGGQISNRSVDKNPQYHFFIQNPGNPNMPQPCSITLTQDTTQPAVPIGFRIFKKGTAPQGKAVDTNWLYQNFDSCPANTEGRQGVFFSGPEAKGDFLLLPGYYILLVHCNEVDQEASYTLQIATKYTPNIREYNVSK